MVKCFADSKQKIQNILDENGGIAVLQFCNKSCTDCDKLDTFAEQMNLQKNIPWIRIDVDKAKDLCKCCDYKGLPSFAVARERWDNLAECRQCHDTKQVLDIFNTAVECRNNLGKFK